MEKSLLTIKQYYLPAEFEQEVEYDRRYWEGFVERVMPKYTAQLMAFYDSQVLLILTGDLDDI